METSEEYSLILDKMPHVAEKIKLFWGTQYFVEYVNILITDTRDGERQGFPKEILKAIYSLSEKHNELYPPTKPKDNLWNTYHRW